MNDEHNPFIPCEHVAIFLVATSPDEGRMVIAYAVVNALALLLLFFAYRPRQRWAWVSIWLVVLATAATIAYGIDAIGLIYIAVAGARFTTGRIRQHPLLELRTFVGANCRKTPAICRRFVWIDGRREEYGGAHPGDNRRRRNSLS